MSIAAGNPSFVSVSSSYVQKERKSLSESVVYDPINSQQGDRSLVAIDYPERDRSGGWTGP